MSEVGEVEELEAILDWTIGQLAPAVAEFRATHTEAETVLGLKADFHALAYVRMCAGAGEVLADYHTFGLALLRLLDARARITELEDAIAMRDACLMNLGSWEDL